MKTEDIIFEVIGLNDDSTPLLTIIVRCRRCRTEVGRRSFDSTKTIAELDKIRNLARQDATAAYAHRCRDN